MSRHKNALKLLKKKQKNKATFLAGQCFEAVGERNLGESETNTQLGAEKPSPATHCAHPR